MPQDFTAQLAELALISADPEISLDASAALARLADHFNKCAWFVPQVSAALATETAVFFQPTNRFLSLMAAARTRDWIQVCVLVHEIVSLPLEPYSQTGA